MAKAVFKKEVQSDMFEGSLSHSFHFNKKKLKIACPIIKREEKDKYYLSFSLKEGTG